MAEVLHNADTVWKALHHSNRGARRWYAVHLSDFDPCHRCGYARINVRHMGPNTMYAVVYGSLPLCDFEPVLVGD